MSTDSRLVAAVRGAGQFELRGRQRAALVTIALGDDRSSNPVTATGAGTSGAATGAGSIAEVAERVGCAARESEVYAAMPLTQHVSGDCPYAAAANRTSVAGVVYFAVEQTPLRFGARAVRITRSLIKIASRAATPVSASPTRHSRAAGGDSGTWRSAYRRGNRRRVGIKRRPVRPLVALTSLGRRRRRATQLAVGVRPGVGFEHLVADRRVRPSLHFFQDGHPPGFGRFLCNAPKSKWTQS